MINTFKNILSTTIRNLNQQPLNFELTKTLKYGQSLSSGRDAASNSNTQSSYDRLSLAINNAEFLKSKNQKLDHQKLLAKKTSSQFMSNLAKKYKNYSSKSEIKKAEKIKKKLKLELGSVDLATTNNPIKNMTGQWKEIHCEDFDKFYLVCGFDPKYKQVISCHLEVVDDFRFHLRNDLLAINGIFEFNQTKIIKDSNIGKIEVKSYFNLDNHHFYNDCTILEPKWYLQNNLFKGDRICSSWYYDQQTGFLENTLSLNGLQSSSMTTVLMRVLI